MNKYLYLALICLVIVLIIVSGVTYYRGKIKRLEGKIEVLTLELGSCNQAVTFQNAEIEKYKLDIENSKAVLDTAKKEIDKKYESSISKSYITLDCEEKLRVLDRNHKEFMK